MTDMKWLKPEKPEGITDWEWDLYLDDDPTKHTALRAKYPHLREKVERAMGWKASDVADAEAIAIEVVEAVDRISRDQGWDKDRPVGPVVVERLRAALRLLENEHITPQGRRLLEKILDEEEKR